MTALTRTGVANLALALLGAYRIEDIDADETPQAQRVRDAWDHALTFCLAKKWNFARAQRKLARLDEKPVARYEHAYQLPGDFLRLEAVSSYEAMEPPLYDYMISGNKLLANDEHVYIEYERHLTNVSEMPPWFIEYFRVTLAAELAPGLKATSELPRLIDMQELRLREARSADGTQTPPKRPPLTGWVAALHGGVPLYKR